MEKWESRTGLLLGECGVEKLNNSRVLVFGLGGVGSYTVEALARAGVGHVGLVDGLPAPTIEAQIQYSGK